VLIELFSLAITVEAL